MAHYIKNKDLLKEVIHCLDTSTYSMELHSMFTLLIDRFARNFTYIYKEDEEDCKAYAAMDCYCYWNRFDPKKSSNAFAYYTQIIKNGYAKGWHHLYGRMPKSSKVSLSQHQIYNL